MELFVGNVGLKTGGSDLQCELGSLLHQDWKQLKLCERIGSQGEGDRGKRGRAQGRIWG